MENAPDRSAVEAQLVEKALKDDIFRQKLLSNAKAALESEFGLTLPPDLNIVVHTEDANTLHIVLPRAPRASAELTADEIQAADCSGWSSAAVCTFSCTQCGNNDTSCEPGGTDGPG